MRPLIGAIAILLGCIAGDFGIQSAKGASPVFTLGGAQVQYEVNGHTHTQPNLIYHALLSPNDPDFSNQWNMQAIQMPAAWDLDTSAPLYGGDSNITIAVLDTGLAYESYAGFQAAPDIPAQVVWTNPGDPVDGLDNDHNGFVDDIHGWDFVNSDPHPNDDHTDGHGTHVAGTIAGATNNGTATAGIAFESRLLPIKVLNNIGNGSTDTITKGIDYAINMGADIINLSLGGDKADPALQQKIDQAVQRGILVLAATGNGGGDGINYPANYGPVIAVGATQSNNQRAGYSDYGPEIDLMAPGDNILQQTCTDSTCMSFHILSNSGTSQAVAHVSGVAALLLACGAPSGSVLSTLSSTALDLGTAGFDNENGNGLVQAASALQKSGCVGSNPNPITDLVSHPSASTSALVEANRAYPYAKPYFTWTGPAGSIYRVTWGPSTQAGESIVQTSTAFQPSISREGTYTLAVRVQDSLGRESVPVTFLYRYRAAVIVIGQTSDSPGVRLYSLVPTLIRSWNGGLGAVQTHVSAGAAETDGTMRIFVTGLAKGRTIKVKSTRGVTIRTLEPLAKSFTGSLDMSVLQTASRPEVVASTRTGGDQLIWMTIDGKIIRRVDVYQRYGGGLQIATGDLDGDGVSEVISAMTAGHEVRVYSAAGIRLATFSPLGKAYAGGWNVTAGDLDGDGRKEIVLTQRAGNGRPRVFVTTLRGVVKKDWRLSTLPYRGEVDIATADTDGDGIDQLVVGYTASDRLAIWSLGGTKEREHRILTNGKGFQLSTL